MSKLKILSGYNVIKILGDFGYGVVRTRGSHAILKNGDAHIIVVPLHSEIKKGLLKQIFKDVVEHARIPADEIRKRFYTE